MQLTAHASRDLVERIQRSEIYRTYAEAFQIATGLPLDLRAVGSFRASYQGSKQANPFCVLLANTNQSCAACLQLQQRVEDSAHEEARTLECFAGLSETAVPVRLGDRVVAYLQTGQVALQRPTKARFQRTVGTLLGSASRPEVAAIESAFLASRMMKRRQYESTVRLLGVFAQHLSALSNQLMVQAAHSESPVVARARQFIAERYSEELSLSEVAKAVCMSAFYFCKTFKKSTGLTFTHYLARVRVEKVKSLLLNPHTRVSEAAFAAGFQSLSQFNRVFLRIVGEQPSAYRDKLHAHRPAGAVLSAA